MDAYIDRRELLPKRPQYAFGLRLTLSIVRAATASLRERATHQDVSHEIQAISIAVRVSLRARVAPFCDVSGNSIPSQSGRAPERVGFYQVQSVSGKVKVKDFFRV